ncbi:G-type lectin S-receptor-like serine/threonine-protein kinase At1g34300 [Aristolochia californica]|uniref:G-type lectin S-receptor-like serine/threonine-protein kinase At1g34300 n=1 Tax=Aristolochia californica TaxID=171875 RepID=UPI0035DD21DF
MRLGSSQSSMKEEKHKEIVGCKGESISDDSSKDFSSGDTEKIMYTEATARRGECSYEKPNYQNEMTNQGIDVTGKSEFSETAAEARGKGVDRHSEEEGESFGQVLRKSPPRRQIISSKMLNFLWRMKQKDHTPVPQLRFAGNVRRERRESEFGSTLPLRSHVTTSLSHLTKFQYSEIVKMTGSFRLVLGNGGFGTVFKGILPDGQEVAVKSHTLPLPQRDQKVALMVHNWALPQVENVFYKEIEILKSTQHANIIRLLGFCSEGRNRFLVYGFMPKGSLAELIHSEESSSFSSKHSKELWEIAIGTARGVEYLHHGCYPPILHLDIKPHNFLLDEELRPKLTDFGISSIYTDSSHCETIVRGTSRLPGSCLLQVGSDLKEHRRL